MSQEQSSYTRNESSTDEEPEPASCPVINTSSTTQRGDLTSTSASFSPEEQKPPVKAQKISPEGVSKAAFPALPTKETEAEGSADDDSSNVSPDRRKTSSGQKKTQNSEYTAPIEKALLELAPRKAKRMLDRRKKARENGEDDASVLWDKESSSKGKSHSLKQIQRLSNELEQVLGVICNGDKSVAADVLAHMMTRRHIGLDLFHNVEQKMSHMSERSLDSRIVDGIIGFFDHHHTRGTRPTEAARAVEAVMVACCWDVCDADDIPLNSGVTPRRDSPGLKRKSPSTSDEKRISNSALIDRLGVNRTALKRAREKAKVIKVEGKAHYKPDDRKHRKDKGVPAKLYREVRKVEEITGSPRETNEYAAIDVLTTLVTDKDITQGSQHTSPFQNSPAPSPFPPPIPYSPQNTPYSGQGFSTHPAHMVYTQSNMNAMMPHEPTFNIAPSPARPGMGMPYGYNQPPQYNPNPIQSPTMRVSDSRTRHMTPVMQRNVHHMQTPTLRTSDSQNRNITSFPQENLHLTYTPPMGMNDRHFQQTAPSNQGNLLPIQFPPMGVIENRNRYTTPHEHEAQGPPEDINENE